MAKKVRFLHNYCDFVPITADNHVNYRMKKV